MQNYYLTTATTSYGSLLGDPRLQALESILYQINIQIASRLKESVYELDFSHLRDLRVKKYL